MKLRLLDRLGAVCDPRFWIRYGPVCHEWSDTIEGLLNMGEPVRQRSELVAKIGDENFWIGNAGYHSFGESFGARRENNYPLPRRRVALRLRRALAEGMTDAPTPRCLTLPAGRWRRAGDGPDRLVPAKKETSWTDATTPSTTLYRS